jgi:molybdopterin-guanine dinucleotide biosynthesis protein A
MNFSAVILAGGRSSRMGRDKAFLSFNGKPLIEHSLGIVRDAGASEVLISGRVGQDFSTLNCPVLLDATPGCGPLGGIERGLSVAKYSLVLVLAVDLPHMAPECLSRLASHCGQSSGAVPSHGERLEPLVAFYPKEAHEIVVRMLTGGRLAARGFAHACIEQRLARAVRLPSEYDVCFGNWNTPEDIARGIGLP